MQVHQRGIAHFVLPVNLLHQQLGVADHLQSHVAVLESVLQHGQQARVLGVIVRLVAEILAQSRDFTSGLVGDDNSVASGARIATRAAINVSD